MEPEISFEKQLEQALKDNLTMDIEFDEDNSAIQIDMFFGDSRIVSTIEYIDHKHEIEIR